MKIMILALTLPLLLTGCATSSSTFSCNKTADDTCLTIEQVDAMTQYADDPIITRQQHKTHHPIHHSNNTQYQKNDIWIAKRENHANHA